MTAPEAPTARRAGACRPGTAAAEVTFDDERHYVMPRESVLFFARAGGRRLRCYVERAALLAHFGAPADAHEVVRHCLRLYDANRFRIQTAARRLIADRALAPEGDVIVSGAAIVGARS